MRAKSLFPLAMVLFCFPTQLVAGGFHADKLAEMDEAINSGG